MITSQTIKAITDASTETVDSAAELIAEKFAINKSTALAMINKVSALELAPMDAQATVKMLDATAQIIRCVKIEDQDNTTEFSQAIRSFAEAVVAFENAVARNPVPQPTKGTIH